MALLVSVKPCMSNRPLVLPPMPQRAEPPTVVSAVISKSVNMWSCPPPAALQNTAPGQPAAPVPPITSLLLALYIVRGSLGAPLADVKSSEAPGATVTTVGVP